MFPSRISIVLLILLISHCEFGARGRNVESGGGESVMREIDFLVKRLPTMTDVGDWCEDKQNDISSLMIVTN